MSATKDDDWLYTISSKHKLIHLNFNVIWRYRELRRMFVKRDIVKVYKQKVFGSMWCVSHPFFTSFISIFIYNNPEKVSTAGVSTEPLYLFNHGSIKAFHSFDSLGYGIFNVLIVIIHILLYFFILKWMT